MKKALKVLLWIILILLLVIIVGGFIFIKTFDLNKYKPYIENMVYEQTGRKLSLDGEAGMKISLVPTIVLNNVSLSNASWAKETQMVKAQQVEASFSVLPLLKKQIVIDTVNLVNPEVYLAVNKEGVSNWTFTKPVQSKGTAEDNAVASDEKDVGDVLEAQAQVAQNANGVNKPAAQAAQGAVLVGIVAKHLHIENGLLSYADLKSGSTTHLRIKDLSLVSEGMDENINLDFDIVYNGDQINGKAEFGSINSLLRNTPDFPVMAEVKALGADVSANMELNDLMGDVRFAGSVSAQNPSGNLGLPSVNLTAHLMGTPKEINADDLSLTIGGNKITGHIKADLNKSKPYVSGTLNSSQLNLQTLTVPAKKSAHAFQLIKSAHAANFVPATKLDLSVLNSLNANLKIAIAQFIVDENLSLNNLNITAALNGGKLNLNPLSFVVGDGSVNGSLSLSSDQTASVNLVGKGIVLQNVWRPLNVANDQNFGFLSGGKTDLSINLSGYGADLRKLVESLNGQVIVIVGESQIQTGSLNYLSGNFVSQLLSALNLQKRSKNMDLTCAVVRSDIANGKVVFPKGIVFNAKQLVIVSDGSINLHNDKLDLTIHPFNGKIADTNVVQAISSLIKIAGTIENPRITLDNSAIIKNVVGVAAAGPAFLGSQMLLDVDDSPCYTALKGTSYQSMFPAPEGMRAAGQGVYQGTSEVVNDSVNAITDTAKGVLKLLKGKK